MMHLIQRCDADLFISQELIHLEKYPLNLCEDPATSTGLTVESMHKLLDKHLEALFYYRESFREYCNIYAKLQDLKPYGILAAHADSYSGVWKYTRGRFLEEIQDWIDEYDGEYGTLIIACCNPKKDTPFSVRSLLFVPDRTFELFPRVIDGKEQHPAFSLIKPGGEEVDGYTIEYELERLKERCKI